MKFAFNKRIRATFLFMGMVALISAFRDDPESDNGALKDKAVYRFSYNVELNKIPEGTGELRIFLPVPSSDELQTVSDLTVEGDLPVEYRKDPEHGNRYLRILLKEESVPSSLNFKLKGKVSRKALKDPANYRTDTNRVATALRPDSLVPLSDAIRKEAEKALAGKDKDIATPRAFYDHLLEEMVYDKTGTGWGKGDAVRACNAKNGNCTDFHSLFIGMNRVKDIPARFHIGFMLPSKKDRGKVGGYHCWAEFYDGKRWAPVDISEAWKNSDLKERYYGGLDPHRIRFSTGRDIPIEVAPGRKEHLNYFIYPETYADGEELEEALDWTFHFKKSS